MITGVEKEILQQICAIGKKYDIKKVILYGSRARGDFKKTSDIDLAVHGGDVIGFTVAVEEETNTLLKIDIVNLDGAVQEELRRSIVTEGKVVYEKI